MPAASSEALIGRTIAGKYAVESLLGSGAMGAVYRARQVALEKAVALKVMHADIAADPAFATRFHREAKAASRLDHPNSIRVIDFGEEPDGLTYIAMEYVDGRDLLKVIQKEWPLSAARIGGIMMQVLGALAVAHEMGVVHRDLKPENIMILLGKDDEGVTADVVKVCDFGIAKITAKSHQGLKSNGPSTSQGVFIGTPEYVSPEQGKGEAIDARSDLYSMGIILFQLLTGKLPFEADNPIGVVLKHVTDEPPTPSSINPAIDRRLEAICLKAIRKRPEDRFQSAREMRSEIRSAIDGAPSGMLDRSGPTPTPPPFTPHADNGPQSAPAAGHADTLQASSFGTPLESALEIAHRDTLEVPQGRAQRSKRVALAVIALVAAVGGAGLVLAFRPLATHADRSAGTTSGSPSVSSTGVTRSAPDPAAIVTAMPQVVAAEPAASGNDRAGASGSAAPATSAHPASASGVAAVAAAPPRISAASGGTAAPPARSPAAHAPAAPDDDVPTFNLTTAGATVSVTKATGATVAAVRAALPSWNFTACYRTGLKKAKKGLQGRTVLQLTFAPNGFFTNVKGMTSTGELGGVADCVFQATLASTSPVQGADPAGGTAEAIVLYAPE